VAAIDRVRVFYGRATVLTYYDRQIYITVYLNLIFIFKFTNSTQIRTLYPIKYLGDVNLISYGMAKAHAIGLAQLIYFILIAMI
jgi:hypothetical protein